ncbi:MAG: acyl-CoA dehydrogenase family protein [Dehalococcoidales bacterium]|nr:acyl-CoA dehydrogenase family protein [Dehalococcoidales bacterium]
MLDQTTQWYKLQYPECFVNEEARMMQKMFADFTDREIMPVRAKIDDDVTHSGIINPILEKLQVDLGCQKNMIPKEYGGNEMLSIVAGALKQEQLSRGDYGISMHSAVTEWAWTPAALAYLMGSTAAKAWAKAVLEKFAPMFTENKLRAGCFNMSESESACDIENLENEGRLVHVTARLEGNEWVINGNKFWASNAGVSDLNCVICNMAPGHGPEGFAMIYVPEPWPGVSHGKFEVKCGMQADRNTATYFDDVKVPKEWGFQGPEAWDLFKKTVSAPMPLNSGNALGILQGAFDVLMEYTGQRVAGGRPVCQHLSAAMILGEMASFLTVARAAYLELAHEYDNMALYGPWDTDSMLAKGHAVHAYITRTVPDLILRGMELMGSYGYVRENNYEKYYRDSAVAKLVMGGSHIGYFTACKQFYPLEFSSFGPGKLQKQA